MRQSGELALELLCLALLVRKHLLCGVLGEAALDHLFHLERFDTQQVEDHVVRQSELRSQLRRVSKHHLSQAGGRWCLITTRCDNDDGSNSVQTTSSSTTCHLGVLSRKQVSEVLVVKLAEA